jgi:predicted nucleic-acid-binding protein
MTRLNAVLSRRWFGVILFVVFMLIWTLLTKVHTHSWQEESRMATVQTLVEQGTFIIDHTEFNRTGDKVFLNEHFYSDKTPLLSVAAAGAYSILHDLCAR